MKSFQMVREIEFFEENVLAAVDDLWLIGDGKVL